MRHSVKILSWNVNGIRAVQKNGFQEWFQQEAAEIVCVQEIKANPEQLTEEVLHPLNYHSFWNPAQKPGYSGVALYSKKDPLRVEYGIGAPEIDAEGRVLTAEFSDFLVVNCYFTNSQRDHARLGYKLAFCKKILDYCETLKERGKPVVLCGDLNIAHQEIDLKNPKSNQDNAGFLPEERAWMGHFLATGYVDVFRHFVRDPGHYTWWSYRPGVREKNIGWRLDYFIINRECVDLLKEIRHQAEVLGSDHCPVQLTLKS